MPNEGKTEVWKVVNLPADAHPIHLHLVQFQLINRQNFNLTSYNAVYGASFPRWRLGHHDGHGVHGRPFLPAYGPPLAYDPAR